MAASSSPFAAPSSSSRSSRFPSVAVIDITVSCRNLPPKSATGNADAFCVMHHVESRSSSSGTIPPPAPLAQDVDVGRTEVVIDTANPDFVISFRAEYRFDEEQNYCLRCYSELEQGEIDLRKHSYIGGFYFNMGRLVGAVGNTLAVPLGTGQAYAILRAEPTKASSEVLRFQLCAEKLKGVGFFSKKSNPFYVIQVLGSDRKSWNTIWQSPVVMNNQSPVWEIDEISIEKLSNGDYNRIVRIQIMTLHRDGSNDDLGGVVMSVNELLRVPNTFEVMRATRNGENKPAGVLKVMSADILNRPTMVDYVTGGCEISLMVAVDFTLSNGAPSDPRSLHYRSERNLNEYQQAILKIGGIVENYATSKSFPIWGFGAKINHVKHDCVNLGGGRPVNGVKGLLEAYNKAFLIPGFDLSGPTNFMPVLRAAAETAIANQGRGKQCYSILVILTDGVVSDVEQAVDMICHISDTAPLSIVIIGVGKADFKKMEILDGDDGILKDRNGQPAERDIVQFVPYRKHATNVDKLASEVLYEIPNQMVGYFQTRNVKPNAPVPMPVVKDEDVFGNAGVQNPS